MLSLSLAFFLLAGCVLETPAALGRLLAGRRGAAARDAAVARQETALSAVIESLRGGLLPGSGAWEELERIDREAEAGGDGAGLGAGELARELRRRGAPVLPTLLRARALAIRQRALRERARAELAGVRAQARLALGVIPLVGVGFPWLLPGLSASTPAWIAVTLLAWGLAAAAGVWMERIGESARWAGLPRAERAWAGLAPCAGERFLAWLRAGLAPEGAWRETLVWLAGRAPDLHALWSSGTARGTAGGRARSEIEALGRKLEQVASDARREGRGCGERIEAALDGFGEAWECEAAAQLARAPLRALRPMYVLVAPALFAQLGGALALALLAAEVWE